MKNNSHSDSDDENSDKSGCCSEDSEFKVTDQSTVENPKNPKREIESEILKNLEDKAKEIGMISIGYSKIPKNVFESDESLNFPNAIVFTMPIGMDIIDEKPGLKAQKLNDKLYKKFGEATYKISDELRENSFQTQVAHPKEELIDLTKLAQEAGIGYPGKSGLLISPKLGSRLKISAILTSIENLPFTETNECEWVRRYCKRCSKCIRGCPQEALIEKDNLMAKADLIEENCIGCSQGCTSCIENCPFYEKGYDVVKALHDRLEAKLKEKGML